MSDSRTSIPSITYLPTLSEAHPKVSFGRAAAWLADTPIPASLFVAGSTTTALILARIPFHVSTIFMVLSVTYASYALDRIVDRLSEPGEQKSSLSLSIAATLLFAVSFGLGWLQGGLAVAACAFFFPLSVAAYCLPWLSVVPSLRANGIRRVKDIPYTKNLYTAGCIALGGAWAALASHVTAPSQFALVVAYMFVADFINTAACDLGDVEADRRNGVPTFAVRFGRAKMARALRFTAYAFYGLILLGAVVGLLEPIALFIALAVLPTDVYLRALASESTSGVVADLAPDLSDALVGLMALLITLYVGA